MRSSAGASGGCIAGPTWGLAEARIVSAAQPRPTRLGVLSLLLLLLSLQLLTKPACATQSYRYLQLYGWNLAVDERLYQDPVAIEAALRLTGVQLAQIVRAVPAKALRDLRQVPIWFSPPHAGQPPGGAYHPSQGWLAEHDRDIRMAKAVELTNVAIFEQETTRMPAFILHELAHAYHDRVLGFDNPEVKAAYARALASGRYSHVERRNGRGHPNTPATLAYAMENEREYFAESTEALFASNDFYPFDATELRAFDVGMFGLLRRLWGVDEEA